MTTSSIRIEQHGKRHRIRYRLPGDTKRITESFETREAAEEVIGTLGLLVEGRISVQQYRLLRGQPEPGPEPEQVPYFVQGHRVHSVGR